MTFATDAMKWVFTVSLSDGGRDRFAATLDADRHTRAGLLSLLNYEVRRRHPGRDANVIAFSFKPA